MGQSFYSCKFCGEGFSDYSHPHAVYCECGESFCDDECAEDAGYVDYNDEDYEGDIPVHPKHGWELESSCSYCRGEIVEDETLLVFALELLKIDRAELTRQYNNKEA